MTMSVLVDTSVLLDLPDEVLLMICSFLPMGDALSVRNTCAADSAVLAATPACGTPLL